MRAAMALLSCVCFGQSFDVASVKGSRTQVGKDYEGSISVGPAGLSGKNVTLKSLIAEAYQAQPHQVMGGPGWLDQNEYDIEAKTGAGASKEQLTAMLRALLAERFRLVAHRETRNLQVYDLVVDKGGAKVQAGNEGRTMRQLADLIGVQLTIPALSNDPSKPNFAGGAPIPVVDKTGLTGTYDIKIDLKPEPGVESFTLWQRFLQDRLGLKLESRKENVEVIVVDSAERAPTSN